MATSRRRTSKKNLGQNLNELESRIKKAERRPRSTLSSYSVTSDLIAPGSITLDKLDPNLLQMLLDAANNNDSTGDSVEYVVSGGTDGTGLVTGVVDSVISQYNFSTTSASGKNSIFWQPTEPTGGEYADGDLWYDTSPDPDDPDELPKYLAYRYNEATGEWEDAQLGSAAFRFLDVGKLTTGVLDASIAIRVGTYPLDAAPVGKSRVEIASSFPLASGGTFSGIRVLKKTADGQTEEGTDSDPTTAGFYQSLEINADTGRFRVGGSGEYLLYDAEANKLSLSGKLVTGTDVNGNPTNESLLIGTDISDEKDGIRMGPYNYWYRPQSVASNSDLIFKVGSSGNEGLTVTKGGSVEFEGTTNPTAGTIKGNLVINGGGGQTFKIGKNLGQIKIDTTATTGGWDGIRLNDENYLVMNDGASRTLFRIGDNTEYVQFDSSASANGRLKITGQLQVGTGTESVKLGRNVGASNQDGIQLGPKNYWYRPETVTSGFVFQVDDGTADPTYIRLAKNGKVTFSGEITTGTTATGPILTVNGFKFGKDVDGDKDGLRLNSGNFWYLPSTVDNGQPIFNIASGGPNSTTTYISVAKGGEVLIKGYHQGGVIEAPITTPPTTTLGEEMKLGANVSGDKDGLYLNENNFWYVPDSITDGSATIKIGGTANYLTYNTSTNTLQVTGQITAVSGNIGGWAINSASISSTGSPSFPIILSNDAINPKIYIGAGAHASTTTPFYADSTGKFSIADKLFFDPSNSQSFGTLTIIGRVRGAIDNVPIIPSDSGTFVASSVTVSGTSPNQTAVVTTSTTHTFAVGDTVIISGLTGNASVVNGAWPISAKTSTTFTVTGLSSATNGTYSGQTGSARVRELTMGLHPAYNGSPAGLGIRLDENNYWFVNNRFRVGTSGSYVDWNGTTLSVKGDIQATSGSFSASLISGSISANQIDTTGLTTQYLNTSGPGYNVRIFGSFSLPGGVGSSTPYVGFTDSSGNIASFINADANNGMNISSLGGSLTIQNSGRNIYFFGSNLYMAGDMIESYSGASYKPIRWDTAAPSYPSSYPEGTIWVTY